MSAFAWVRTALVAAVIAHLASLAYVPHWIMSRAMDALAAAGPPNAFRHPPPADASSRTIVRPSPDLLYSICLLDLREGPVRVRADPSPPYTSVSVFAPNSDNVLVLSDRDLAAGARFDLWVARSGQKTPVSAPVAALDGDRGIVLVRRVVTDADQRRAVDALRRQALCARG